MSKRLQEYIDQCSGVVVIDDTPFDTFDEKKFARLLLGEAVGIIKNDAVREMDPDEIKNMVFMHFGIGS